MREQHKRDKIRIRNKDQLNSFRSMYSTPSENFSLRRRRRNRTQRIRPARLAHQFRDCALANQSCHYTGCQHITMPQQLSFSALKYCFTVRFCAHRAGADLVCWRRLQSTHRTSAKTKSLPACNHNLYQKVEVSSEMMACRLLYQIKLVSFAGDLSVCQRKAE